MPEFPHMKRRPLRSPEQGERELWQPRWICYCCHDSGFVAIHLVRLVIPDYNLHQDERPLCHAKGCNASDWAYTASEEVSRCLDWRFTQDLCNQLVQWERKNWKQTIQKKFKRQVDTQELAQGMNLRQRDRTEEEQQLAEQRHQKVMEQMNEEVA